jgi:hypothetical protein
MSDYSKDLMIINSVLGRGLDEFGQPRPYTDEEFFLISHQIGANQFNSNYRKLFEVLSQWIIREINPKSSLEIGAGPGYLLNCLNFLGVDSVGVDGNEFSKKLYSTLHPLYRDKYFLDKTFVGNYGDMDLLIAIECFEHINDEDLNGLMTKISTKNNPKKIIFSSTPFTFELENFDFQWGHINIKSESEWIDFFAKFNYKIMDLKPPVTEWALAFELNN